jgi:hypothetical protein
MIVLGKWSNILTPKLGFESIRDFKTATPRFVNTWMSSNWEAHVTNTHLFCINSTISKLNYKDREKKSSP